MDTIRLTALPGDLDVLSREADAQGHHFLRRLIDEWATGANRFVGRGEALFGARIEERLVGVGGLNRDPYLRDLAVGRVRHLYVLAAFRRRGVGRQLVESIVAAARGVFRELRLRTDSEQAARFYERLGFRCVDSETATHAQTLVNQSAARQ